MNYVKLKNNQSGQGVIAITTFFMMILLASAAIIIVTITTENNANFLDQDKRKALQSAETGIEDARIRLSRNPLTAECATSTPCTQVIPSGCTGHCQSVSYSICKLGDTACGAVANTAVITSNGTYRDSTRKLSATLFFSNGELTDEIWSEL